MSSGVHYVWISFHEHNFGFGAFGLASRKPAGFAFQATVEFTVQILRIHFHINREFHIGRSSTHACGSREIFPTGHNVLLCCAGAHGSRNDIFFNCHRKHLQIHMTHRVVLRSNSVSFSRNYISPYPFVKKVYRRVFVTDRLYGWWFWRKIVFNSNHRFFKKSNFAYFFRSEIKFAFIFLAKMKRSLTEFNFKFFAQILFPSILLEKKRGDGKLTSICCCTID